MIALIVAVSGIVVAAIKLFYDTHDWDYKKRKYLVEEYEFSKHFLENILDKDLPKLEVERAIYALTGVRGISLEELKFFMAFDDIDTNIVEYHHTKKILKIKDVNGKNMLLYRDKFKDERTRKIFKRNKQIIFFVILFMSLLPYWFTDSILGFDFKVDGIIAFLSWFNLVMYTLLIFSSSWYFFIQEMLMKKAEDLHKKINTRID